ncbi:g11343 [Coccomyxa elongata]
MSHTNHVNMDDDDSYTGSEVSTAATDPLDDFLARYTASFNPEYCIKLRKSVASVSIRANRYSGGYRDRWAFVVKPSDEERQKWLHKLTLEPAYCIARVSTAKLKVWDILRLQVVAQYDWEYQRPSLQWKVTSKWSRSAGKLGRREKLRSTRLPSVELHPHWRVDLHMPEVEGQLGLGNGGEAVSVDKGHCHITVPKMEMVVSLDTIGRDTRSLLRRVRGRLQNKVPDSHRGIRPAETDVCSPEPSWPVAEAATAQLTAASGADDVAAAPLQKSWWARQRQDYQEASFGSHWAAPQSRPDAVWIYPPSTGSSTKQLSSSTEAPWKPFVGHVRSAVHRVANQLQSDGRQAHLRTGQSS